MVMVMVWPRRLPWCAGKGVMPSSATNDGLFNLSIPMDGICWDVQILPFVTRRMLLGISLDPSIPTLAYRLLHPNAGIWRAPNLPFVILIWGWLRSCATPGRSADSLALSRTMDVSIRPAQRHPPLISALMCCSAYFTYLRGSRSTSTPLVQTTAFVLFHLNSSAPEVSKNFRRVPSCRVLGRSRTR